jgi:microcystin-dependent protein
MTEPYIGEIRLFSFAYAPPGWAVCNGQALPIAHYAALFAQIGVRYGGDGTTTFHLPDLRGRTLLNRGDGYPLATPGGAPGVCLAGQIPKHTHPLRASTDPGTTNNPAGALLAAVAEGSVVSTTRFAYAKAPATAYLASDTLAMAGSAAAHNNMQPSLVISYCIALTGLDPASA